MKKELLNTEIQEFINSNLNSDITKLLLKGVPFKAIDAKQIVEQIESKKRCLKKLPNWFNKANIYYPNKLNIEQTSSETTAEYKASLVSGTKLIDLTGGFGVDTFYFAKKIDKITHCEINTELSDIVNHNYKALNVSNIRCINENGIEVLKQVDQTFDWIYIDPSRRDNLKKKVFLIEDCEPNIKAHQALFLKYSKNVMIKTSPLLDLSAILTEINHVKEIHIVASNNEVKELLWIIERNFEGSPKVKTVNLKQIKSQFFEYVFNEEYSANATFSKPLSYLYEPNAAVLKSGGFNSVSESLKINKLHQHSHLYTSNALLDFPGRRFIIKTTLPFNKKSLSKENISKANITTRNFPLSVDEIRKKLKIKHGGNVYLFFTTDINDHKIIIVCSKVL
ncbi:class I SAM-dependent methyltransferase [Winogradskyella litoriviva]|uniref:Class I SAM-dependent methyltransferase n=1 Tax=Winogradskyella litoriviva TaxID=1220182 RepID=A0ABX2E572_9FLAO|nr:class I SAM-dependent methyltransferase [Winogradskyella litoriviva]NRD23439.1 class I SAM-dependent methyltransferase [Winogradskyella litoriviva]